jgi:hypothetical protein
MECKECGNEVDTLYNVKVGGKRKKLCEDCIDRAREEGEAAQAASEAVRDMLGAARRA